MVITETNEGEIYCYQHGFKFLEKLGLGKMITQDTIHFAYKEEENNAD